MTVIITAKASSTGRVYHTKQSCRQINRIRSQKEIPKTEAEKMGLDECRICRGEVERVTPDRSTYQMIKAIGEDDE